MKYALQQTKVRFYLIRRLIGHEKRLVLNSFNIIIGFYLTITILSNKGRHFVCLLLAKNYQIGLKSLQSKKSLQESTNRASECLFSHHSYNSLSRMRAIHELKMNLTNSHLNNQFPTNVYSMNIFQGFENYVKFPTQ